MFIGITNPDNTDNITIKENPNSVPGGICPTTYGSKKIYSEIIESGISIPTKIAAASTMYALFEKTSLIASIYIIESITFLKTE